VPVRSDRLFGPTVLEVAGGVLYTVPAGRLAIVKSIRVVNITDATARFSLAIGSLNWQNAVAWELPVMGGSVLLDSGWWCLEQEEQLHGSSSSTDDLVITASGALLVL